MESWEIHGILGPGGPTTRSSSVDFQDDSEGKLPDNSCAEAYKEEKEGRGL